MSPTLPAPQLTLAPIGRVESPLVDPAAAPRQGDEGAPDAVLVFDPSVREGLRDLAAGDEVLLFTWLDRARRDVLSVHPRGDRSRPRTGVFSTRSPDRPNPIGLHRVQIVAINNESLDPGPRAANAPLRIRVRNLEALDGTPILDVKPVLEPLHER
jgi:tRNA-Thr(GGU) m(6)t(6)A37 methyltransferase TsaA